MTLDRLLKRLSDGDKNAFDEIYRRTNKTVYYIALSIVKDRSLAEDVMQSVYLKIIRNASGYQAGNPSAWIARIARNEAISLYRSRARETYIDERETPAVFGTEQTDDYGLLIDMARRLLDGDQFAILILVTAEGYKRREIAEMLDMPVATVTWKYNNALKIMRSALGGEKEKEGKK